MYMAWGGRKIHKILTKFREESSSRANLKTHYRQTRSYGSKENTKWPSTFFKNVFKSNCTKSCDDCKKFLNKITTPVLTSVKAHICEGDLVESELFKSLSSMQNCKSPGNDRLTKEFYKHFWDEIKDPLINSIKEAKKKKKLSISQWQAVIKLIDKITHMWRRWGTPQNFFWIFIEKQPFIKKLLKWANTKQKNCSI